MDETTPEYTCSICSIKKPKKDFSRNQQKKPNESKKCNSCVTQENNQEFTCSLCGLSKKRNEFTTTQIQKEDNRKCRPCTLAAGIKKRQIEKLLLNGISNPEELVLCSLCGQNKPKLDYNPSQIKKKEKRICILCLSGHSLSVPAKPLLEDKVLDKSEPDEEIEMDEAEKIELWQQELEEIKLSIKEKQDSLDNDLVGHEHRNRRKTARDQLSKMKMDKEDLKDKIEAAKAYLHIQEVLPIYNKKLSIRQSKCLSTPVNQKFVGKYIFVSADDGNLVQHHLVLSGKTCTLHASYNNSKKFDQKSGYTFDFQGKYYILKQEPSWTARGYLEFPEIKKIHNARQTQPPKYKREFFEDTVNCLCAFFEGVFGEDGEVTVKVHYRDLFLEDNLVLSHYFFRQEYVLRKQS